MANKKPIPSLRQAQDETHKRYQELAELLDLHFHRLQILLDLYDSNGVENMSSQDLSELVGFIEGEFKLIKHEEFDFQSISDACRNELNRRPPPPPKPITAVS